MWYRGDGAGTLFESFRSDASGRLLVGTSSNFDGSANIQAQGEGLALKRDLNTNGVSNGLISFYSGSGSTAYIYGLNDGTQASGDTPGALVFSTTADGASSPTERMRITSEGYLLVNATSNASNGMIAIEYARGTTAGMRIQDTVGSGGTGVIADFYNSSGTSVGAITHNSSNTTYSTTSDYRVKENVKDLTGAIERIFRLNPCRFNFTESPDLTVDGFIAHEVQDVVPEAVVGNKDDINEDGSYKLQGIDQSKLVPLLTAALQEALQKIETLEQRLSDAGIA